MDSGEGVIAATVAQRFYIDGDSKIRIAEDLGISRFKVTRLLNYCVEQGIVTFTIRPPLAYDTALSTKISKCFGLRHAIVVNSPRQKKDSALTRQKIGIAAARLLSELVTSDDVFGIGWGRTTSAMVHEINELAKCPIVQMGGIVGSSSENSLDLVRRVSEINGGEAYPLFVPLVVRTAETAMSLRAETSVNAAISRFDSITIAAVAVGSWDPLQSQMRESLDKDDRDTLHNENISAEVLGSFIRKDGSLIHSLDDRTIAMNYERLTGIENLILVAGGAEKANAVNAVFKAGLGNTLVTDQKLANALLKMHST